MEMTLEVRVRDLRNKPSLILSQGKIPAIYYGLGQENLPLEIDYQTFRKIYQKAGESTILDLHVDSGQTFKVLVQDVQRDPVSDSFRHVDFLHVDMKKEIVTSVPVEHTGEAPAVKDLGGTLTMNLHQLEIRCLPQDLPHSIVVDISPLVDFQTSLHVKDIIPPKGVEILDSPEITVITVTQPREEEVEEAPKTEAVVTEEAPKEETSKNSSQSAS